MVDNPGADLLTAVGASVIAIVLVGAGTAVAVRDARRDRARRRSVVAGQAIRYRGGRSYRPRSALWTGLMFLRLGGLLAPLPLLALTGPGLPWPVTVGMAVAAGASLLVGVYFLVDQARTATVEGVVLERKIIHTGPDDEVRTYWFAVDDGHRARVDATPVGPDDYARVVAGTQVRLRLTPRGRQLQRLDVLRLPPPTNPVPPELARSFPPAADNLWIRADQAARLLEAPVEVVAVAPTVPGTRCYTYVPLGTPVIRGAVFAPALHATEAPDPQTADELTRRVMGDGNRSWRSAGRGVRRHGLTYLVTWGEGVLLRGQVAADRAGEMGRLVAALRPPAVPGR